MRGRNEIYGKMRRGLRGLRRLSSLVIVCGLLLSGCRRAAGDESADMLLTGGKVYTFMWDDPAADGAPAKSAPYSSAGWRPDAEAIAVRGSRIVFVGSSRDAEKYRGPRTRVIDLQGATVIPGLVDSHTHVVGLGEKQSRVDLIDVQTEEAAVERVVAFASKVPKGEWIVGRGWDEGAWANRYPTMKLLSERVPDHPVLLVGLHSFAVWGNKSAFDRATTLLTSAVPAPTDDQLKAHVLAGLNAMARDGYVAVHEAGADLRLMRAFESLAAEGKLPVRVYAMLSARDAELCRAWLAKGPKTDTTDKLTVRSVKAFYDGALGSRGALLFTDYSDKPGHRGVSAEGAGFDQKLVADMMKSGFQVAIHAIGDAGNRGTLDFIEQANGGKENARFNIRDRVEHAQVIHPDDFQRFAKLGVIASMQPPHCAEDKSWAEDRLGPERVKGAYAWRALRRNGTRLIFNSDLVGSDHNIFYGLHAAITRRDKQLQPPNGWYPEQRVRPEEAVRAYSTWAAYAAFWEKESGVIAPGRWADITVMDIDPLNVGESDPARLLQGKIRMTMVAGQIVHSSGDETR
ncbi:MAG TPA: amidohydrolase [Blastocatellia bacterium]|nr:amidohydrolase [Blastocatellia bacterium]